jgi:hypothetical protein
MLYIEPSRRATLSELLRGRGKPGGLVCRCGGKKCGGDLNESTADHKHLDEDEDDGDEWLSTIQPCSYAKICAQEGTSKAAHAECDPASRHAHTKIESMEKAHKKRFF